MLYFSHYEGEGCREATEEEINNRSYHTVPDLSYLNDLTVADAKSLGKRGDNSSSIIAIYDLIDEN